METKITKRIQGRKMIALFDSPKINIRSFVGRNIKDETCSADDIYTYDIVIRHTEEESAEYLLKQALKDLK